MRPIDTRACFEIFAERSKGIIKVGKSRRYCWRLKASNGEVVCSGESYHNKRDCEKAIYRLEIGSSWVAGESSIWMTSPLHPRQGSGVIPCEER